MGKDKCINCQTEYMGTYCYNCGQKQVSRLTFKRLFGEIQTFAIGFDSRFIRTVKDLMIRPGFVVKEYIRGNRVRYMSPVGYYILIITASLLMFPLFGYDLMEYSAEMSRSWGIETPTEQQEQIHYLLSLFMINIKFFIFLLIPFSAILLKLFFRKSEFNIIENSVFSFYVMAQGSLFGMINLPLQRYLNFQAFYLVFIISIAYFVWVVVAVYKRKSVIKSVLKGIFVYLLAFLSLYVMVAILTVVYLVITK